MKRRLGDERPGGGVFKGREENTAKSLMKR